MSDEAQAPEVQDQPTPEVEAPATSGPGEAESNASLFEEKFDESTLPPELQSRYREMQADYTRKTQELATQRQEAEAAQSWLTALNDPQTKDDALRQLLEANGLTLEEADDVGQEELTEAEQLQARLERIEQAESKRELEAQANELGAKLTSELEAADTGGLKMNEKDTNWIMDRVLQHMTHGQEVTVQQVVDEYRQLVQHHVDGYVESKKAPRTPSPGQAGSQLPDNTARGRAEQLAAIIAAEDG